MVAPEIHALSDDEVWRVNRGRLAFKLHKLPSEIDAMPYPDYCDLVSIMQADRQHEEQQRALRRGL